MSALYYLSFHYYILSHAHTPDFHCFIVSCDSCILVDRLRMQWQMFMKYRVARIATFAPGAYCGWPYGMLQDSEFKSKIANLLSRNK
ncbi:hypothetical protein RSAG8_05383, partial [Rhizoctonia solani AG-8 WAC10335]